VAARRLDRSPPTVTWEPEPLWLPIEAPRIERRDRTRSDDDGDEREPGSPGGSVIVIDLD
jgi:hypothetical protein